MKFSLEIQQLDLKLKMLYGHSTEKLSNAKSIMTLVKVKKQKS